MRLPVLLALGCGVAMFWAGYTDAYFPQNDVFSYYQIFHYTYSSALLNHQIPLWEPYASYGIPSAFELAFTFGPTKAAAALAGYLFRITNIKALYFGAVGADFALIGLAAAWLARDLTGRVGPHVSFAAVAMPASHYMETLPTGGYGFTLTMLFVLLFLLRFMQTRRGVYLAATGLTLVANIYGNPQYMVIPETYLALLFALMIGLRYRNQLAGEWRDIIRSLFTVPSIAIGVLTAGLLLGLLLIDREILPTVEFTARLRDPHTLLPSLHNYLYYLYLPWPFRVIDLLTGRAVSTFDVWLYFGTSSFAVLMFTFVYGWSIRFVAELLVLALITTVFSLPGLPLAKWTYEWLPGMKLYRPVAYALVYAKPFVLLAIACVLASPRIVDGHARLVLLRMAAAILICAIFIQSHNIVPKVVVATFYWDSFDYGWIAIGGVLVLVLTVLACRWESWMRWAPMLLALVLAGELLAHRIAFEINFYQALAKIRQKSAPYGSVVIGPWYQRPRQLVYQPTRVPNPPIAAPFSPVGSLYHGLWSFLSIDPCMPGTRSDSYVRWISEALERRGAMLKDLGQGQLSGLGGDFDVAYGCGRPKLSVTAGTAQMTRFTANEVAIAVTTPAGGTLTYRDAWTPAWQATVDGVPASLGRNRDGFKTLAVPPGEHRVDMVFRPRVDGRAMLMLAVLLGLSVVPQIWLGFARPGDLSKQPV
jgi:hypothetical protein